LGGGFGGDFGGCGTKDWIPACAGLTGWWGAAVRWAGLSCGVVLRGAGRFGAE